MLSDEPRPAAPVVRRVLLGALLGALALLCFVVIGPLVVPITWAAILAYTSWPAYRHLRRACRERRRLAALLMTLLVAVTLIVPMCWVAVLLQDEVAAFKQALLAYRTGGPSPVPAFLRTLPWLGDRIQPAFDRYATDPLMVRQLLLDWAEGSRTQLLNLAGSVGRNLAKLFLTILTLFFFYRDGESLAGQAARVLRRFFGERLDPYVRAAGGMTRAVIYGLLITALVQGVVGGIGYAIFRVEAPTLLGCLTAVASVVPLIGTLLVWGPVGLWLIATDHLWAGLGLLAWGALLVHPADNLLRPLIISSATRIPFLVILFGVLGGLAAFGLVGLFVGPVALTVATAVWREWLVDNESQA
jgi:predicted PurR-regulated permease PerM